MLKYKNQEKYTVNYSNKEIEYRAWTAKDEKNYLNLLENKNKVEVTDESIYNTLIKPCITDKSLVLSSAQQKLLIIEIRKKSISDKFKDTITCDHCKNEDKVEILIDDVTQYRSTSYSPITIENMTFTLADIKSNKEKSKLNMDNGIINYIYNDFMLHISSIEIEGELNKDFKFKELSDFMDSLPTKIFDEIFDKYQEQVDLLELSYTHKCSKCGKETKKKYENIPGLLWI